MAREKTDRNGSRMLVRQSSLKNTTSCAATRGKTQTYTCQKNTVRIDGLFINLNQLKNLGNIKLTGYYLEEMSESKLAGN